MEICWVLKDFESKMHLFVKKGPINTTFLYSANIAKLKKKFVKKIQKDLNFCQQKKFFKRVFEFLKLYLILGLNPHIQRLF